MLDQLQFHGPIFLLLWRHSFSLRSLSSSPSASASPTSSLTPSPRSAHHPLHHPLKSAMCVCMFLCHTFVCPRGIDIFHIQGGRKKAFLHEVGGGKTFFSLRRDKHFLLEMVVAMMRFMVRKRRRIGAIRALKFQ